MKRRIVAVLLALCMCIGLLPATALAAGGITDVTGDDVYEGAGNVEFRLYTTDAYKLLKLADDSISAETTIDSVNAAS